ncbi:hypothetical protein TWF481_005122 [Arthrobotrys musiformis]|uniref:Uncharacterized protein n=1 Tax=Arthrobotrys musiformis TaxID=47236 RepID=A0AAV9WCY7_9PEZI
MGEPETQTQASASGAAAAISLESNGLSDLLESLEINVKPILDEQGPPTASFETLGSLKAAGIEQLGGFSSAALLSIQSEVTKSTEPPNQLLGPHKRDEASNTPHPSPEYKKHTKRREKRRTKKVAPAKSVKEELQAVAITSLACDQILSSASHRDASVGDVVLLANDREFTKSVSRAITNFQQRFPSMDTPLPRISQRRDYEVAVSPATKSLLKKRLSPASKNLLNFEKGGALSSDYHIYTVKSAKVHDSPVLYTALGSLRDNVLVIDNLNHDDDKTPAKPLAAEIAFDAWLWIPPSVKPEDATTEDIKQLRLILEQDDSLQSEAAMLDLLAEKLFDAGEFKPCQPIRLALMSESQMREECFYLLSGMPGLERLKEMLRNHSKMLGGCWPSEIHILKVDGRWARLTILQREATTQCRSCLD